MPNNSFTINDLKIPPSNHLEQLKGDRKGEYSIRINDQWRICFEWDNGNSPNFWLGLQNDFDLEEERLQIGNELLKIHEFNVENTPTRIHA